MNRDPRRAIDRAHDILDAITNINNDLGALSKEAFLSDGKTQLAGIEWETIHQELPVLEALLDRSVF